MKKKDVKIGETYRAKVSGKWTRVTVVERRAHEWIAVNVETGRRVLIRSGARLHKIEGTT